MLSRRTLLSFAALPAAASTPSRPAPKVETVFKSPGPKPNGLQATADGLWIIDQGDNHAYLVRYEDGKVLRDLSTEADRASGITFDGEALWLASTYSRELIRSDAKTGKTLRKYFTPGAGVIYQRTGDPSGRSSPLLKSAAPSPAPAKPQATSARRPTDPAPGTGAHGLEWRDGKLWVAVPPSRTIYRIDPKSWTVEHQFPTAGNRPHGIGWQGAYLWATDSNYNAFFKHDPESGKILEKLQLAESDPLPHGMTIWQNTLWYCDDVGVVCKFALKET